MAQWIKIVTNIFDDEKILLIEALPDCDSIIVIWFKLLCMAGKQDNGGVFLLNDRIAYTDEMLATIFKRPVNTVRLALNTFEQFGMIEIVEDAITIPNWEKHQKLEQSSSRAAYMREYMREYRRRKALTDRSPAESHESADNSDCKRLRKPNVSVIDIEKEKEKEIEKRDRERKTASRFSPPSLDEVRAYCAEKKLSVDPERFIDYYESVGWKVGRNPMKDWKAAIRGWERRRSEGEKKKPDHNAPDAYSTDRLLEILGEGE